MTMPLHATIADIPFLSVQWIRLAILAGLIGLIYIPAGFYPVSTVPYFNNRAILQQGLLELTQPGIAVTPADPAWLDRAMELGEFELTLELRPKSLSQSRAVILSLSVDQTRQDFLISQVEHRLYLRIRAPDAAPHGARHIYLPRVFTRLDWQRIVIKIQRSALSVKVNGQEMWAENLPGVPFGTWSGHDTLSIGNALEFNRPWLGAVRKAHVRVGTELINLLDGTHTAAPALYQFIRGDRIERFVMPAFVSLDGAALQDWCINFFGFIPLGFALVVLLNPRRPYATATLGALALSLVIEIVQLWLPWRVPSSHDLALNTLGGFVGAWVAVRSGRLIDKWRVRPVVIPEPEPVETKESM